MLLQQCHTAANSTQRNHNNSSQYSSTKNNNNNSYSTDRNELLNLRQRRRERQQTSESDLHQLSKESDSIQNSRAMIVDIISGGEASYQELKSQRRRMNSMSSVLSNISDTIGLSKLTIQIIERRDITDAYYVVGGMIITLIVLYITWFM